MLRLFLSRIFSQCISIFLILCLWFNSSSVYAAEISTNSNNESNNSYSIIECKKLQENDIRITLEKIIKDNLNIKKINIDSIVTEQWQQLDIDTKINTAIDESINQLQKNTSILQKLLSSINDEQAEKLIKEIMDSTFKNKSFLESLEQLSMNIGNQLSNNLTMSVKESTKQSIQCFNKILGNYSPSFQKSFNENIKTIELDTLKLSENLSQTLQNISKNPLSGFSNKSGIGIGLLITTQVLKTVGKQVTTRVLAVLGERFLGRLATLLIPGAEAVAATLLVADGVTVVNNVRKAASEGPFSKISEELKKDETKNIIKSEIIKIVNQTIDETTLNNVREKIVTIMIEKWHVFLIIYDELIKLSQKYDDIKEFIDQKSAQYNLSLIAKLVAKSKDSMLNKDIANAFKDGTFEKALSIPEKYWKILDNYDLYYLNNYYNLLGSKLDKVVDLEIYKSIKPESSNKYILEEILSISDDEIIKKIIKLNISDIQTLLTIRKEDLILISSNTSSNYLSYLANYLNQSTDNNDKKLIRILLDDDQTVTKISILQDLVNSSNIKESFNFWTNIVKTNLVTFSNDVPSKYLSKLGEYLDNLNQEDERKLINLLLNDSDIITTKFVLKDLVKSSDIKQSLNFWKIILPSQLLNISPDLNLEYLSELELSLNQQTEYYQEKLIDLLINTPKNLSIIFILNDLKKSQNIIDSLSFWQKIYNSELLTFTSDFELDKLSDLQQYLYKLTQDDGKKFVNFLVNYPQLLNDKTVLQEMVKSGDIQQAIDFWKKNNSFLGIFPPLPPIKALLEGKISIGFILSKYDISPFFLIIIGIIIFVSLLIIFTIIVKNISWLPSIILLLLSKIFKKKEKSDVN